MTITERCYLHSLNLRDWAYLGLLWAVEWVVNLCLVLIVPVATEPHRDTRLKP